MTQESVARTHEWFDRNSGWAEPTIETLTEWLDDDVCQCPDECWVEPTASCEHGLASWYVVLRAMGEHPELHAPLRLASAPNFRDVGGVAIEHNTVVRRGTVFRSGVLDQLNDEEVASLGELGLRTVIDLRGADEISDRANRLPAGVDTIWLPVLDVSAGPAAILERLRRGDASGLGADALIKGNTLFAERHAEVFGEVVRVVADAARRPVVIHCTAGKDRTGFAVACLLWTLGARQDAVVADYLRSNRRLAERHAQAIQRAADNGIADPEPLLAMLHCRHEYLDAGYEALIRRHGSVDAFVRDGLGLDTATVNKLRQDLLTPNQ